MKNYKQYIESMAEAYDEVFNQELIIEKDKSENKLSKASLKAFLKTLDKKYN